MNIVNKKIIAHLVALDMEYSQLDAGINTMYVPEGREFSKYDLQKRFLENPENNQYLNDLLCNAFNDMRERGKETTAPTPIETEQTISAFEQRTGIVLPQDLKEAYLAFGCRWFFMNHLSSDNNLYGNSISNWFLKETAFPFADYIGYSYYNSTDINDFYDEYFGNDIEYINKLNQRFFAFGLFFNSAEESTILILWDIELQKYALFPFLNDGWDDDTMDNLLESEYSVYDTFEDMIFDLKNAYEKL